MMKKTTNLTRIAKGSAFALIVGVVLQFAACSKSKDINPSDEEILTKKIEDIIPQQYVDSLTKLGFTINKGTTPPNINGSYLFKPFTIKSSNIPNDSYQPGYVLIDGVVKFYEQNTSDFSIKMLGKNFIGAADTSMVTAISGNGNKFTVYGKVKAYRNGGYNFYAFLMSGEKDGNNIKNGVAGIMNIDDSHAGFGTITKGQGRVAFDGDYTSEPTDFNSKTATITERGVMSSKPTQLK
ncbi:hypothetical protein SAMN05421827_10131 [Pedobacter terrae]|uniref:Transferrin-binding protein B C-lobe/N-lobe beta barrel domain-containing protein n=1 Tax=Pedobacter terrae TaxID=405671 RepID=A0A1G7MM95_9SPHI|nr:hypothetical protein [Pedobacter terrae]SDF62968.1 hypothetical protein SAMN05421827_10131 [Pedobacter terrae]